MLCEAGGSCCSIIYLMKYNLLVYSILYLLLSIQKLRDSGTSNNSNSSSQDGINATVSSGGTGTGSGGSNGWLNHIMAVLKGAVSVADSLMLGHPTLVHCSDGWYNIYDIS